MAPRRCVRDYIVHDAKERPSVRKLIQEHGWRPLILGDVHGRYWNGRTVQDVAGRRATAGDSLRMQIRRMAAYGEFGEEVAAACLDGPRYQYIQERLLDSPDPDAIAKEVLHQFNPACADHRTKR